MKTRITICMGSSCFARGNNGNLRLLEDFVRERGLSDMVELVGACCVGKCAEGPNVKIGDRVYHRMDAGALYDLLNGLFPKKAARNGNEVKP